MERNLKVTKANNLQEQHISSPAYIISKSCHIVIDINMLTPFSIDFQETVLQLYVVLCHIYFTQYLHILLLQLFYGISIVLPFLILFGLIIMWDCTAPKMHLTQVPYVICT